MSPKTFRSCVARFTEGAGWVVDGDYSKVRDLLWGRADTLVWLDYTLPIILGRLLWRTLKRILTREELWSGNRERFRDQFFIRKSVSLWALYLYWRTKRTYPVLCGWSEYAHLTVIRFRSPRQVRRWLKRVRSPTLLLSPGVWRPPSPR